MHLFERKKPNADQAFLRYGDMLYRLALTHLGHDADAQDVVQDVFVKYMTASPAFEDTNHEKAWLIRTAINRCHDLTRRNKVRTYEPIEHAHHVAAPPQESAQDLWAWIAQLPPIYKNAVVLHALEGFSIEETAKILNVSTSAVKMRLSRARDMLRIKRKEDGDVF